MQNQNLKPKPLNFEVWFLVFSFPLLAILGLCGCSAIMSPYVVSKQQELAYDAGLSDAYYKTKLKKSGAHNVLPIISKPEHEMTSQSRSVVASSGQSEAGYKTWFSMVAFDKIKLTAKRKYFFLENEKVKRLPGGPKLLLTEPKQGLMFDCQMVMEKSVLDRPYTSDAERQILILRQVLKNLRKDIDEISQGAGAGGSDNKILVVSGLVMNQVFNTIFRTLDQTPALAATLSNDGVEFEHINFGNGKIRMMVTDDIVTVKLRLGVFTQVFGHRRPRLQSEKDIENH